MDRKDAMWARRGTLSAACLTFAGAMFMGVTATAGTVTLSRQALRSLALPNKPPVPAGDPMTPAKIALGKELYFDPRLSSTGTVSCNSCHNVMGTGTDNRKFPQGVNGRLDTSRSAPTVFNAAFLSVQFWDGRAPSLEAQAKAPILNPKEMGMPNGQAVAASNRCHPRLSPAVQARLWRRTARVLRPHRPGDRHL